MPTRWHHRLMRTTIHIDDDVFELVKTYAAARSIGLGRALSELARRGLKAPPKTKKVNGLVVFDLPQDEPPVTLEKVKKLESENW